MCIWVAGIVRTDLQWPSGDGRPVAWRLPFPAGLRPCLLASACRDCLSASVLPDAMVMLLALSHGRLWWHQCRPVFCDWVRGCPGLSSRRVGHRGATWLGCHKRKGISTAHPPTKQQRDVCAPSIEDAGLQQPYSVGQCALRLRASHLSVLAQNGPAFLQRLCERQPGICQLALRLFRQRLPLSLA